MLLEQLEIGSDPTEVGRARRWARARLAGAGVPADEPLAETLILLISELVTNAVVHTGYPAVLCMLLPRRCGGEGVHDSAGSVRVEVADASTRAPRHRQAEGEDTGGRGLELVSGLADRWGWEHEPGGKRVWCELDAAPGQSCCGLAPSASAGTARAATVARPADDAPSGADARVDGAARMAGDVCADGSGGAGGDARNAAPERPGRPRAQARVRAAARGEDEVRENPDPPHPANGPRPRAETCTETNTRARVNVVEVGAGAFG